MLSSDNNGLTTIHPWHGGVGEMDGGGEGVMGGSGVVGGVSGGVASNATPRDDGEEEIWWSSWVGSAGLKSDICFSSSY